MGDPPPAWGLSAVRPKSRNARTVPEWLDPRGKHEEIIFLRLKPNSPSKLPKNPFIISTSVEQLVGKIEGVNPIDGGSNFLLKVRNPTQAAKLMKLIRLTDGTPFTIEQHPTLDSCHCVVTCNSVDGLSDEKLQKSLADQGVTNVFLRKTGQKTTPTNSMVLTLQGSVLPPYIYFGFHRVATRPYYPRPLMCYRCERFGHSKNRCPNTPICINCGESSPHDESTNPPHCANCGGNHSAMNRSCPLFKQEQSIVRLKVDIPKQRRCIRQQTNNAPPAQIANNDKDL
ncbi:uncharacterized protein LOC129737594 [Uranotaenia lowii]|uniref:uncharacterized protein LOC129737594 n=1 Tax=Uranotaenia lowii TaxID=190385 RepID=UPI00247A6B19|nr:uncharacterized protein LOC129737594 [Uranotaenia lowii]